MEPDGSQGVIVGPGPDNPNVLYQRFPVLPREAFRVIAKASSIRSGSVEGRIQINWLDENDQYISTSIKVINVGKEDSIFTTSFVSPAGAKTGMVYVSPHGKLDIVKYTEMRVLGK